MDENALGGAIEKLKDMLSSEDGKSQIQDIIGMFAGGGGEEESGEANTEPSGGESGFDMSDAEMLLKIRQVVHAMNNDENNQHTRFLRSLRPYLKEPRQKKLDSAVRLIGAANAMKALGILNREGGEDDV